MIGRAATDPHSPERSATGASPADASSAPPLALRTRGLGFTYPDGHVALRQVDLRAREGEVVGLMGPNGSGKSTLLRICATALRPGAGELSLFPGRSDQRRAGVRRRIAAVFDHVPAAVELSGRENLVRMLALRGEHADEAGALADRWLSSFDLSERAEDPVSAYSYGMRRKLGFAEAFASRADLLLLDEATGGLDAEAREALVAALDRCRRAGRTVLLSSHDHGYLARVSDRVVLLREGEVLADASPAALLGDLDGRTLIDVKADGAPERIQPPDGVRSLARDGEALRFVSERGDDVVPELCRRLLRAGGSIRVLRVREADLGDAYRSIAGDPLEEPEETG